MLLELIFYNNLTVVLICLLLALGLWIRWVKSHFGLFEQVGIPGPKPTFLFGNALDFANKMALDVFAQWAQKYGKVYGFYEGLRPSIVVTCPKLGYEILVKNFQNFADRPAIHPFLWNAETHSLQHSNGLPWKRQRQAVSAGMSGRCIREMFPTINEVTDTLLSILDRLMHENPDGIIVDGLIERFSMDWFCQAGLGYHSNTMEDENEIFIRYLRGTHESVAPDNQVTGIARLFPSLTPLVKNLDKKHKEESVHMNKEVSAFIQEMRDRPACPVLHHLRTRIVTNDTIQTPADLEQTSHLRNNTEAERKTEKQTERVKPESPEEEDIHLLNSDENQYLDDNAKSGSTTNEQGASQGSARISPKVYSTVSDNDTDFNFPPTPRVPIQNATDSSSTNIAPSINSNGVATSSTKTTSSSTEPQQPPLQESHLFSSPTILSAKAKFDTYGFINLFSVFMKKLKSFQNSEPNPFSTSTSAHLHERGTLSNNFCEPATDQTSKSRVMNVSGQRKKSIVDERLNFAGDKQKSRLSDTEIVGEIMGLAGGGIGPFSSALTFTLYCLALYQDEQVKVREEVDKVTTSDDEVTMEDVQNLDAVERFIFESIRLFPVAPGVSRTCVEDCRIDGVHFTKGVVVRVITSVIYSSGEHFEEPEKFNPDRFKEPIGPAWLPFGLGPRKCVGDRLALAIMKLAVAKILKKFTVQKSEKTQIPLNLRMRPFLMARDGIHIKLCPR